MNLIIITNPLLNTIVMYVFLNLILKRNNKGKYFIIIYLCLFGVVKLSIINIPLYFKFIINAIIIFNYLHLFYENKFVSKVIVYCIYTYLEMSLYLFLILINIDKFKVSNFNLNVNGILYCNPIYVFIEKIILLVILLIITYKKRKNIKFSKKYSFIIVSVTSMLMLILVTIMFIYMLKDDYYKTKPKIMIVLLIILITLVFVMIYLLKFSYILLKEPLNNNENKNISNFNNKAIEDKHVKYILHDMKNHIQNINVLIENKKYNEATKYSNEMYNIVNGIEMIIKTGNNSLDAIMNNKIYLARKDGIDVTYNIKVPNRLDINSHNLSVILDNILDNAIEANDRITDTRKKFIDINIKYNLGYLFIKVINSYSGIIKSNSNNKKFISSKREENKNGIGIENIKKIVDLYAGEIKFDYDENQFSISIFLNL